MKKYVKYIILAVLLYFPIFGHLDTLPIRIWDEARYAQNAYEMLHNSNFLVLYADNAPDMWSTKPPFMIWCIVIWMKLIGVCELAVRLPSALAALFTCIALLVLCHRYLKSFWLGFITVIVLITSQGYIELHAARTGDMDALLTLFTTTSGLFFFAFCETKHYKYLYYFFTCLTLAVLTKGVEALLFAPALVIYGIIQKQVIPLLKSKHFYIGVFSFLAISVGYYLLREMYNPGYIHAVMNSEVGGRYQTAIDGHEHEFLFYFNRLIETQFAPWYLLLPCGLIIGVTHKNKKINRLSLFLFLMVTTFFLIISSAQTKVYWYDVPLYPFLSLIVALFIYLFFELLENLTWLHQTLTMNVIPYLFLFIIGITPYQKIINKTYAPQEYPWLKDFYEINYYLKDVLHNNRYNIQGQYLINDGHYHAQNLFYVNALHDKGITVGYKETNQISVNDTVIIYAANTKQYVEEHFNYDIISSYGNTVITYKILDPK